MVVDAEEGESSRELLLRHLDAPFVLEHENLRLVEVPKEPSQLSCVESASKGVTSNDWIHWRTSREVERQSGQVPIDGIPRG